MGSGASVHNPNARLGMLMDLHYNNRGAASLAGNNAATRSRANISHGIHRRHWRTLNTVTPTTTDRDLREGLYRDVNYEFQYYNNRGLRRRDTVQLLDIGMNTANEILRFTSEVLLIMLYACLVRNALGLILGCKSICPMSYCQCGITRNPRAEPRQRRVGRRRRGRGVVSRGSGSGSVRRPVEAQCEFRKSHPLLGETSVLETTPKPDEPRPRL